MMMFRLAFSCLFPYAISMQDIAWNYESTVCVIDFMMLNWPPASVCLFFLHSALSSDPFNHSIFYPLYYHTIA